MAAARVAALQRAVEMQTQMKCSIGSRGSSKDLVYRTGPAGTLMQQSLLLLSIVQARPTPDDTDSSQRQINFVHSKSVHQILPKFAQILINFDKILFEFDQI